MLNLGKKIKSIFFVLLLLPFMLFNSALADGVKAEVASTEIVKGNMAQLRLVAEGDSVEFPNISMINNVNILGRHESQSNSFTYINGNMENKHTTTLILTFAPQEDMTIPAYEVKIAGKVYKTNPIDISVVKATVPKMDGKDEYSLQLRLNKKSAIVGEPILATVFFSIHNGVRLSENPQYTQPKFDGFFVEEVKDPKTYMEGSRQVTELRYILTPKQEGNFTIGPASAKIGIADRTKRDMFGRFFATTWTPIVSNTTTLSVEPAPQNSDLVGKFTLTSTIDANEVKANKPVNLTVKIVGEGSLEDFEYPAYEIDGVTVYSDDAEIKTDFSKGKVMSSYVKRFAFIADHDFTIPERKISVYDIESKSIKELHIKGQRIHIKASHTVVSTNTTKTVPAKVGEVQSSSAPEKRVSMLGDDDEVKVVKESAWWELLLAFLAGGVFVYLLRFLPKGKAFKNSVSLNEDEALKRLYPHINSSKKIEEMVRKLYAKKRGDKSVEIDKNELKTILEGLKQ